MNWQEIREHRPEQWLLVETIKAHSEANKRILEQLAVRGAFPDSVSAMKGYTQLHREAPEREMYVFHTSRARMDPISLARSRGFRTHELNEIESLLEHFGSEILEAWREEKRRRGNS